MSDKNRISEDINKKLDNILTKFNKIHQGASRALISIKEKKEYRPPNVAYYRPGEIRVNSFDASNLQKVVDEIKVIEDGIKGIIASRTKKVVEEKVPVEKQRPVKYNTFDKALISIGLKKQETETYTDYEIVQKEVPGNRMRWL